MGELFNIDLETADLTQWSAVVTDSGDLSVTAPAALGGTDYGMAAVLDDANEIYGEKDHTSESELRTRVYLDMNSLSMATGAYFKFLWWKNAASSTRANVYISYNGSNYYFRFTITNDSGGWIEVGASTITDAPHYIELYQKAATGAGANDGIGRLWIDGVLIDEITTLDTDANNDDLATLFVGATDINGVITGTIYIDEIVQRDDNTEIGPVVTGGAVPAIVYDYRRRRVS
jgi:hypothetical protein